MTASELDSLVLAVRDSLRHELLDAVHAEIESYRKSRRHLRNVSCCAEMRDFMTSLEQNAGPVHVDRGFGNVTLQLRGHVVLYCPFCGIDLTVSGDAS